MNRVDFQPINFTVLTDIHYYSKKCGTEGKTYDRANAKSQLLIKDSEKVIRACFEHLSEDDNEIILISGDTTKDGEKDSHFELIEMLRELKSKGKRVYVITATHDYRDDSTAPCLNGDEFDAVVPAFRRDELFDLYREFGPDEAISVHAESMSYVVKLCDGYRLFALNDDKNGDGKSGFSEDCFRWIIEQAQEAKEAGDIIIPMTHHPMIAPSDFYALIGKNDMMADCDKRIQQFADLGISFIFTGHSHIHDISYREMNDGSKFYTVSTSALVGYPGLYRKVCINPVEGKLSITSHEVSDNSGKYFEGGNIVNHMENQFFGMIKKVLYSAAYDYEKFIDMAQSFSVKPDVSRKYKFLIKPLARFLNKLKIGTAARWAGRKRTKLKKSDYCNIKDERVFDFILSIVMSMYAGDAPYTPDTNYYKITMAVTEKIDSVLNFFGIKINKFIKGAQSVSSVVEPLMYNKGICDREAVIDINFIK